MAMHPPKIIEAARQEFRYSAVQMTDAELSDVLDNTLSGGMFLFRYQLRALLREAFAFTRLFNRR